MGLPLSATFLYLNINGSQNFIRSSLTILTLFNLDAQLRYKKIGRKREREYMVKLPWTLWYLGSLNRYSPVPTSMVSGNTTIYWLEYAKKVLPLEISFKVEIVSITSNNKHNSLLKKTLSTTYINFHWTPSEPWTLGEGRGVLWMEINSPDVLNRGLMNYLISVMKWSRC